MKNMIITMRCSEAEKEMINRKAFQMDKSFSQYVLDSAMAGCERKTDRDKKRLEIMMNIQEKQNEMQMYIRSKECDLETVKNMLIELQEKMNKLWEC